MNDLKDYHGWADTLPSQMDPAQHAQRPHAGDEIELSLDAQSVRAPLPPPQVFSWRRWCQEGLRTSFLLKPRLEGAGLPGPWQALAVFVLIYALRIAGERLMYTGPVVWDWRSTLATLWTWLAMGWLVWWAARPAAEASTAVETPVPLRGVPAWATLTNLGTVIPLVVAFPLMAVAQKHPDWFEGTWTVYALWVLSGGLLLWSYLVSVLVGARFASGLGRKLMWALGVALITAVAYYQGALQSWTPDYAAMRGDENETPAPALQLSQETFETQQALLDDRFSALSAQRDGVVDVYGLVFSPYADEEVFRRESTMVASLLEQRFDAQGRVLHLLNHRQTADSHVWATPLNLRRAVQALARRMDRKHDVLVVYLTSHGARNFALEASHDPLHVDPVTPDMLRAALDDAGIVHRVIAVSACFSGGWVDSLATPTTLVMTAADATHTSYGCGSRSELTFFGRAVFDEALRQTHSFVQAFERAVPVIKQREIDAKKNDGFSNPQIKLGEQIAPVLQALEDRLDALPQTAAETPGAAMGSAVR